MKYPKTILSASILAVFALAGAARAGDVPIAEDAASATEVQKVPAVAVTDASPPEAQQMETVVVHGIGDSLKKSLDDKHNADTHVEVITAEDIGKMPDKNVADSLMRVPGVTTSSASANEGGFDENDRVSMRGTNPSLTQTLINGHAVSSGDWFVLNQTGTVGRSVTYTLLPSELVGKVVVHKTSEASDVEGGVAGSVDIQSRKPLEFNKPLTIGLTAGGVYAENPDKTDPQFSGLFNWMNDDKTFGILAQAFSEKRHLRRDGQELLGYEQIAPGSAVATAHPDLAGVWYPKLLGSALFEQERKRTGGLVDIEWAPTQDLTLDLSAFTSKMDAANYNRNYMMWGTHFINQGAGQSPDPGYVVRNGTLVSANFTPVAGTQYGVYDQISRPDASSKSTFVDLDIQWRATDALTFYSKLGQTKGNGRTPTQDVAEWNTGIGSGAAYNLHGTGSAANWSLGPTNTGTPADTPLGWIFGDQNINVRDKENWAQLDGIYQIANGVFSDVKFGGRYADHTRRSNGVIGQGPKCADGSPGGQPFNWSAQYSCTDPSISPFNPANFPEGFQNYPSDFGSGLGHGFPRNVWFYSPDQLAAFNRRYTTRVPGARDDWNSDYSLSEKNSAIYGQLDFAGQGWSANGGLRAVRTEEHVVANVAVDATTPGAITVSAFGPYLPTSFENSYTDILPSANFKFDLADDLLLRLAASKTMTRADYSALAGAISLSPPAAPGGTGSGSGSNPDLKPVRSNNLDASLEWYFAPRSLLSASVFYMDLTNYIGLGHVTRNFITYSAIYPQGFNAPYVLTVPVNSSGSVKGVELAYEQPLFDNVGIAANYTYADGSEKGGGPLVGTSKNTYNVSAYYEDAHFNARLSYTYRSNFFSGLDRSTAFYQDGVGNLAGSLGYKLNDQWSFSFDALNLNNPKLKYYALNTDQPRSMYENGRQYYFSVHFNY
ncbi:MAG: TonB-dependent receptor [Dokdonella sp.]